MRASAIRWEPVAPVQAVPGHCSRSLSSPRRSHPGCDTCQGFAVGSSVADATETDAETALEAVAHPPALAGQGSAGIGSCRWRAFGNGSSHSSTPSAGQSRSQSLRIRGGDRGDHGGHGDYGG